MVDFNNEATITTAPQDIVKIMILERRKYVIDAFEHYYKTKARGIQVDKGIIQCRLIALFLEWRATLERVLKDEKFEQLQNCVMNGPDLEEWKKAFFTINTLLDSKRVIRIDTIKQYDSTKVETENEAKGL